MTDDQKKMLTEEILDECWHELARNPHGNPRYIGICSKCKQDLTEVFGDGNRTFTTWQDLGDLKRKIVEMGEWDEFIDFTLEEHGSLGPVFSNEAKFYKADYIDWLMDKIRFPELVAEWWTERKVKG